MALKDITFKQEDKKYISDPIEVRQDSVGLQMQFETGGIISFHLSYDGKNFQPFANYNYGKVLARPIVGLSDKCNQYIRMECTTEPISAQYTEAEE